MGSAQTHKTTTFVLCPWCLRGVWDIVPSQKLQPIPGSAGVILGWDRMGTRGFCLPISPGLYLVGAEDQLEVQPGVHTDVLGEECEDHIVHPEERDKEQRGLRQPPAESGGISGGGVCAGDGPAALQDKPFPRAWS